MTTRKLHPLNPLRSSFTGGARPLPRPAAFAGDAWSRLDQVQELGPDGEGHTGCVNALSWSDDGSILLSGSDDKKICIWVADTRNPPTGIQSTCDRIPSLGDGEDSDNENENENENASASDNTNEHDNDDDDDEWPVNGAGYPLTPSPHPLRLKDTIVTGHRANIFAAKFLPHANSPTIVSCAGDGDVRVFDVERLTTEQVGARAGMLYGVDGPGVRVLRCHTDRTKRIATEGSPNLFLTVSEDGTVRQHDLRRPHRCRAECPDVLFRAPLGVDLYSLSVGELAPHTFAVAGQTDVAYVCDRRKPEHQTPSWGKHTMRASQVYCVRRLGLPDSEWAKVRMGRYASEQHITCVKISPDHPDEVICAFATHSTSLFSLNDTPEDRGIAQGRESSVVPPNKRKSKTVADSSPSAPTTAAPKRRMSDRKSNPPSPSASASQPPSSRPRTASMGQRSDDTPESAPVHGESSSSDVTLPDASSSPAVPGPPTPPPARSPPHSDDDKRELMLESDDDEASGDELDITEYLRVRDERSGVNLPDSEGEEEEEESEDDEEDMDLDDDDDSDSDDGFHYRGARSSAGIFKNVDLLYPRRIFTGARNHDTVKDCNFLGDSSDKVCSGSDDGNWFLWDKLTGRLEGIWKGDDDVVNVMEQHPTLPVVAVSGIDHTVKMFTPTTTRPPVSMVRTPYAERIMQRNARRRSAYHFEPTPESNALQLLSQILQARRAANPALSGREHLLQLFTDTGTGPTRDRDDDSGEPECRMQ